jgi:hypothetical protein
MATVAGLAYIITAHSAMLSRARLGPRWRLTVKSKILRGLRAVVVCTFFGVLSTAAFPEFKPTAGERADCMPDVKRLCGHAMGNRDRFTDCLAAKRSRLSPECRSHKAGALRRYKNR